MSFPTAQQQPSPPTSPPSYHPASIDAPRPAREARPSNPSQADAISAASRYPSPPASPIAQPVMPVPSGAMGPPRAAGNGGSGGYASMTGASMAMQQAQGSSHTPGRAATGGQAHSHRPASAMPTPSETMQPSYDGSSTPSVLASMNASSTYADRRASAHPTMSSSHTSANGVPPMSGSDMPALDTATSNAISSGIPVTSPATMAYFAAHPRRQQVHFGSYLLLQTLGEGEFGKVKLGVHKEWGEEVAVKLIKREKVGTGDGQLQINGPPKDPSKMTKVEREIQVLKDVRHPNIVRLYEVIESDRYIGIVLEYASGGELFDHILAHKYLKERDACRLFAQLISGVSYLHQKKIVHRDLKLENLLLDRNRNVIITDFGFANNFEDRRDDLMATSCGSPCYAAPELVVQDGLYAGSAVDVWSCGVILYAMLAGYLPFDDDPANPDGDNINLLYKYIMATPLSFPDYISAEPRDLLSRMLVPDPLKRADLEAVMAHSWLSPYRDLFKFSVEDLERAAVEQQTKKRQVYRQQMQYQAQIQEQQRLQQQQQLARSQSTRSGVVLPPVLGNTTPLGPQTTKSQRHQSAMAASTTVPDRIYDSMAGMPASTRSARHATAVPTSETPAEAAIPAIPLSRPPREPSSGAADPVMAQGDARGEPRSRLDDSLPPSSSPASRKRDAAAREAEAAASAKSKKSQNRQRHTIQLEYEEPSRKKETATRAPALPPVPTVEKKSAKSPAPVQAVAPAQDEAPVQPLQPVSVPAVPIVAPEAERVTKTESEVPQVAAAAAATHGIAVPNGMPSPVAEQVTPVIDTIERPKQEEAQISSPAQPSKDDSAAMRPLPETRPPTTQSSPARPTPSRYVSNPLPPPPGTSRENLPFPHPSGDRVVSTPETKSRKTRPSTAQATPVAVKGTPDKPSSRHRKGLSTDKFFFSRLLGNTPATDPSSDPEKVAVPSITGAGAISELPNGRTFAKDRLGSDVASDIRRQESAGKSSGRRKAMSLVVGRLADQSPATREREKANAVSAAKTAKEERRLTGRPRRDTSGTATPAAGSSLLSPETPKQTNVSLPDASPAPSSVASSSLRQQTSVSSRPATGSVRNPGLFQDGANDSTSTVGPSSNAAKKVMDWFRKKSLSRGTFTEPAPLGPFELTVADRNGSVIDGSSLRHDDESNPRVVVTGAGTEDTGPSSVPSSRSTSGTHSQTSQSTAITSATEASNSNSGVKSSASTVQQTTPRASASAMNGLVSAGSAASFHDSKLRFHLGAVDQSALTSRPPPEVFAEVKQALFDMGIDVRKEKDEDFKLDCVRRKKAKTLMGATTGLGLSIRTSVFPPSQADFERSSRMPASPTSPTPSGPGGSIRNFLRRGSAQAGVPGMASPPSGSVSLPPSATSSTFDAASPNQPSQSLAAQQAQRPSPLYGDASVDGGQEIRFSVEVTKINNLPGLYSLDIRRMKGNLWAYKFIYHALLDRCQLNAGTQAQRA